MPASIKSLGPMVVAGLAFLAGCDSTPDKAATEKKIREGIAKSPEWKDGPSR